jgi:hypothetical protein
MQLKNPTYGISPVYTVMPYAIRIISDQRRLDMTHLMLLSYDLGIHITQLHVQKNEFCKKIGSYNCKCLLG